MAGDLNRTVDRDTEVGGRGWLTGSRKNIFFRVPSGKTLQWSHCSLVAGITRTNRSQEAELRRGLGQEKGVAAAIMLLLFRFTWES